MTVATIGISVPTGKYSNCLWNSRNKRDRAEFPRGSVGEFMNSLGTPKNRPEKRVAEAGDFASSRALRFRSLGHYHTRDDA